MKYIYLVPSILEKDNVFMYCNYARNNNTKNVCMICKNECKHKGTKTVIERE